MTFALQLRNDIRIQTYMWSKSCMEGKSTHPFLYWFAGSKCRCFEFIAYSYSSFL